MNVQAHTEPVRLREGLPQELFGTGVGGVGADEATDPSPGRTVPAFDQLEVGIQLAPAPFGAAAVVAVPDPRQVGVEDLFRQYRPDPDLVDGVGEPVGVVVNVVDRGAAGLERLDAAEHPEPVDIVGLEVLLHGKGDVVEAATLHTLVE